MPWDHCDVEFILDDEVCPRCGATKDAWTVQVEKTRHLVIGRKPPRARWSALVAGDGETVRMHAEGLGLASGAPVTLEILERDERPQDDDPVGRVEAVVTNGRVEASWTVRYEPDDEPQAHLRLLTETGFTRPTWYFRVLDGARELVTSGREPERLLTFRRDLDLLWRDRTGAPLAAVAYRLCFRDGKPIEGVSAEDGHIRLRDVPPGPFHLRRAEPARPWSQGGRP